MKIYDCFIYSGEKDLLEIRLHELGDYVDIFVICEATTSFTNKEHEIKEIELPVNLQIYKHKIRHIKVSDMPRDQDPWINESYLRNSIKRGLQDADYNDLIILGDADEILRKEIVHGISEKIENSLFGFKLNLYYFHFDYRCIEGPEAECIWNLGARYNFIRDLDLHKLRYETRAGIIETKSISDAGWHFSYFLDRDGTINKIKNFSHQEYNKDEFLESINIEYIISEKKDLYGRSEFKWDIIMDKSLPDCIFRNEKYQKYIFIQSYKSLMILFGKSLAKNHQVNKNNQDFYLSEKSKYNSSIEEHINEIKRLNYKIDSIYNSLCWKCTSPLRIIDRLLNLIKRIK